MAPERYDPVQCFYQDAPLEQRVHKSMVDYRDRFARRGRVVQLKNVNVNALEIELEAVIKQCGFQDCVCYWPPIHPGDRGEDGPYHKGWCRVVFRDENVAQAATKALDGLLLKGVPLITTKVTDRNGRPISRTNQASTQLRRSERLRRLRSLSPRGQTRSPAARQRSEPDGTDSERRRD